MGKITKVLKWLLQKTIGFLKWLYHQLQDPANFIIFIIVWLIFFCPWWGGWLLYLITKTPWHLSYSTAWMTFWSLPFTPALAIIIAITLGIRKLMKKILNKANSKIIKDNYSKDDETKVR